MNAAPPLLLPLNKVWPLPKVRTVAVAAVLLPAKVTELAEPAVMSNDPAVAEPASSPGRR